MKSRCPSCGHIADTPPPTHKCPKCDAFSHEWLIYDWESFSLFKHRHIKYDAIIICVVLINLIFALALESTYPAQWLFSLLLLPAAIDLLYCRKQLRKGSEYRGHKGRATRPWFSGLGPF